MSQSLATIMNSEVAGKGCSRSYST